MYTIDYGHFILNPSRFHYDVIKKKYGGRAQLLFADTDSLMYEIATAYVYEDISGDETALCFGGVSEDKPILRPAEQKGGWEDER